MADYGISEVGFKLKRLANIRESLKNRLLQIEDPDTGETLQVDLDEDDPMIQVINIFIDELTVSWELVQEAYNQFNPSLASGASLSGLVQLNGILRKKGTPSIVELTLTGSAGVLVPAGAQFTDANNEMIWETAREVYLDSTTGIGIVTASSISNGAFLYSAGDINTIITQIPGLETVTNATDTVVGTADESDVDLRYRRNRSTLTPAQSVVESIYGAILNIEGVTICRIYVNNTLETDGNGIPAKSIAVVVGGGDDEDVAQTIFLRLGIAVGTHGNTSVTFTDSMQQSNTISFQRPTSIPIYVDIDISIADARSYPADAQDRIKENIVFLSLSGASGIGIEATDIFEQSGFLPGDDVSVSDLYPAINAIPGLKINSVQIGTSIPGLGTSDVALSWDKLATFSTSNIKVTVT